LANEIRLLIVEENENDILRMVHAIKKSGYDIHYKQVACELDMRSALVADKWDIVLSDYLIPEFDGLQALLIVREYNKDLPFILVSGPIGELQVVEIMERGAYDCIMKDNFIRLVPAIERGLNNAILRAERIRDQEALSISEERYRSLLEQSHEIVQHIDVDGRIRLVNQSWLKAMGYNNKDEIIGRKIWDFIAPDFMTLCQQKFEKTQSGSTVANAEVEFIDKQGDIVYLEGVFSAYIQDGVFTETHSFFRNITPKRRAEEALRENEDRLNAIVENLPHGICLLDSNNMPVMYNKQAFEDLSLLCDDFGSHPITAIGTANLQQMMGPFIGDKFQDISLPNSNRIFQVFARSIDSNETRDGSVIGIIEVTHERQMLEIGKRQDRLAAVGQLAAGIAHDFNNILSIMMGFAQVLCLREDIAEKYKEDLNRIYTQGQRANELVRQILDFSRQNVVNRQVIELGVFVQEITKLLRRLLPANIEIAFDLDVVSQKIEGDVTQIQQLITNLALNARDAMSHGGVLGVQLQNIDTAVVIDDRLPDLDAEKWVVLQISDEGCGMTDEVISHIFEPFFTTKKNLGGTGLGMAQVYGIVQQHDAHIHIDSIPGKGTTFSIFFPQRASNVENSHDFSEPFTRDEKRSDKELSNKIPIGNGETVFVVEDEKSVRDATKELLKTLNYQVICAENGREVLDLSDDRLNEVDLIISDLVMPNVGGGELCAALEERNVDTPIIIMSGGYLEDGDLPKQARKFNNRWLEKPIDRRILASMVYSTLSNNKR